MMAVIFECVERIVCCEVQRPNLQPGEVLIQVAAATVCATDFHIVQGDYPARVGTILGHEIAGHVVQLGTEVDRLHLGDLVSVEPHHWCGMCKPCQTGKAYLCPDKRAYGVTDPGGLAEYIAVDQRNCYPVASGISPVAAALAENVACCLHGIDRARIRVGQDVVILGAGAVGQILLQIARRAGACQVIMVEPSQERRDWAIRLGATVAVDPYQAQEVVLDATQGNGADVVIDASGHPDAQQQTLELVGRGGTIEFFGVAPRHSVLNVNGFDVYQKELNIIGSALNWAAHRRAVAMLPELRLEHLVNVQLDLPEIAARLSEANLDAIKLGYVAHV